MVVELARFPSFNESLGRQIYPLMAARARLAPASLAQWYLCEKSVPSSCWRYTVRTRGEGLRLRGGTWHCSQTNRTRDIVAQLLDATVWGPRVADEVASRSRLFGRRPPEAPWEDAGSRARRASNPRESDIILGISPSHSPAYRAYPQAGAIPLSSSLSS
jgi:hypothetical protein